MAYKIIIAIYCLVCILLVMAFIKPDIKPFRDIGLFEGKSNKTKRLYMFMLFMVLTFAVSVLSIPFSDHKMNYINMSEEQKDSVLITQLKADYDELLSFRDFGKGDVTFDVAHKKAELYINWIKKMEKYYSSSDKERLKTKFGISPDEILELGKEYQASRGWDNKVTKQRVQEFSAIFSDISY